MKIDDAVRGALDNEWRSSREVLGRHRYGAESTTSKHLNVLAEIGEIARTTHSVPAGGFMYVYRNKCP